MADIKLNKLVKFNIPLLLLSNISNNNPLNPLVYFPNINAYIKKVNTELAIKWSFIIGYFVINTFIFSSELSLICWNNRIDISIIFCLAFGFIFTIHLSKALFSLLEIPLTPDDVANVVIYTTGLPENIQLTEIAMTPNHQADGRTVHREK